LLYLDLYNTYPMRLNSLLGTSPKGKPSPKGGNLLLNQLGKPIRKTRGGYLPVGEPTFI
jgi:hypothetical protein